MSYNGLLKQRCTVKRMTLSQIDGLSMQTWATLDTGVRCFVDLNFIRQGKDPLWTPEAGHPSMRRGTLFIASNIDIRSGDRIEITLGPKGTFSVEGAVDQAWRPTQFHHLELGIIEVQNPLAANATPGK